MRLIRLDHESARIAGLLSHGEKQWLEIGMLLMQACKLLLLDEPVAGMSDEETARTAELFLSLAGHHSLVVVEHDMAFIETIARKVTVLDEGRVIAEGPFFFQAEDGIRDGRVTGVQTCALPICPRSACRSPSVAATAWRSRRCRWTWSSCRPGTDRACGPCR